MLFLYLMASMPSGSQEPPGQERWNDWDNHQNYIDNHDSPPYEITKNTSLAGADVSASTVNVWPDPA